MPSIKNINKNSLCLFIFATFIPMSFLLFLVWEWTSAPLTAKIIVSSVLVVVLLLVWSLFHKIIMRNN